MTNLRNGQRCVVRVGVFCGLWCGAPEAREAFSTSHSSVSCRNLISDLGLRARLSGFSSVTREASRCVPCVSLVLRMQIRTRTRRETKSN